MRELLADRNSRLYLIGTTASSIGDNALWLTVLIWVKVLTGSTSQAGLSIFMLTLGVLTGPATGLLVDRVRRRPLLITTYASTAAMVGLLLLVHGSGQLWLIDLVMFGYGASGALVGSAQAALVKCIVAENLLGAINALVQTISQGARLVTPLISAGLFSAFGARPIIVADVITFLLAIGCLLALRVSEPAPVRRSERWLLAVSAGARHLMRTVSVRQIALACMVVSIAFGLTETVSLSVVTQGLNRPATFIGVLACGQGIGAIAAGVLAPRVMAALGEGLLVAAGLTLCALSFLLMVPANPICVGAAFVMFGGCVSCVVVGSITLLQRRTPIELLGRANAALDFLITVPQTAAIALGAALVAVVDYRLILVAMAAVLVPSACYLGSRREQRQPTTVVAEPG